MTHHLQETPVSEQITLDDADRIARAALAAGRADGARLTVAVLDARGHELWTLRDGAGWFTPAMARAKAASTVAMSRPSGDLAGLKENYPELFDVVAAQVPLGLTTLPGGVPLAGAYPGEAAPQTVGGSGQ